MSTPEHSEYQHLQLRSAPHLSAPADVPTIMRNVVGALLPVVALSIYLFGLAALLLVAVTTLSALLTEGLAQWLTNRGGRNTLWDYSAAITGILLGLTLPPGFPLWMAVVGAACAILLGKLLFGGLGSNVFNPALVGRAFLQAAFPVAITTWSPALLSNRFISLPASVLAWPLLSPVADGTSGATPLAAFKFSQQLTPLENLVWGGTAGSTGETGALLIALCGGYLALRKMLDWRIPVGILGTVAVISGLLHTLNPAYPDPGFMVFSGGLMLGAVFMATDMVTSPVTPLGIWAFAALVGALVVVIRVWGGLPEGVMYAILLGNAATPLLNLVSQPRVYGKGGRS